MPHYSAMPQNPIEPQPGGDAMGDIAVLIEAAVHQLKTEPAASPLDQLKHLEQAGRAVHAHAQAKAAAAQAEAAEHRARAARARARVAEAKALVEIENLLGLRASAPSDTDALSALIEGPIMQDDLNDPDIQRRHAAANAALAQRVGGHALELARKSRNRASRPSKGGLVEGHSRSPAAPDPA